MTPQTWPAPGALNVYTCQTCGKRLVTRDRDEGTTPFLLSCRLTKGCPGPMQSACYPKRLPADLPEPTLEWIKPTPAELVRFLKTQKKRYHRAIREHVAKGGLIDNPIPVH